MREIGSEFWIKSEPIQQDDAGNDVCLLSGRTALRFIIEDICATRAVKKALLPSYCCESMLQPFSQLGIELQFYQVYEDHIDFPENNDVDVVVLIDFFGYADPQLPRIAQAEKQAGKVIIYDATHKLDGNPQVQAYADYSFCSYRKWFYCNYARAIKHNGAFSGSKRLRSNDAYVTLRDQAAGEKEKYFAGVVTEKDGFLSQFYAAEQMLDEDYIDYAGVPVSFACRDMIAQRRKNAAYLMEELKKIPEIKLWRDELQPGDVPMFVPVLVAPHRRNALRNALIRERIYCPIHWPRAPMVDPCDELYDRELSLVCDQRYDIADMERMVCTIREFFAD